MEMKAKAKYIKMSPKKIRLVVNIIRKMDVNDSLAQLKFMNKLAAKPVEKLLNSAVANAKHNFGLERDNLYIKEIKVDEGPTLKRWRPRAFGRAGAIRKRSSHISLILDEKEETIKKNIKKSKIAIPKLTKEAPKKEIKKEVPLTGGKKDIEKVEGKKPAKREIEKEIFDERKKGKHRHKEHQDHLREKGKKGFVKKIFRRKAG
ncbi:MAG: 50S ribosomal protein L22 [Xanthomonadaceae bacterium]|nr:50S ribosomal protein L22 [Rhodospirillaceae bacterium]NIA17819.1 50S ribosomal protein L22 [Xanthomonadaceae bacterium]